MLGSMSGTGRAATRLILIRGNPTGGKSGLARTIRAARPRGSPSSAETSSAAEFARARRAGESDGQHLDLFARFALDRRVNMIVGGILGSANYGADQMRRWWREADPLPGVPEETIDAPVSLDDAAVRVLRCCGW